MKSAKALVRAVIPRGLRRLIKQGRSFGLRHTCPICRSHLRRFHPHGLHFPVLTEKNVIGGGYRPNGLCPVCGSTDRERLLYLYLSTKTNIFSEKLRLLHVAPEAGLSKIIKGYPHIDYLTADINLHNVMVQMDITEIGYPDEEFDVIICNHVLEHVADDRKAMGELFRVLKPGGWGIMQVPISLSIGTTYEDFSVTAPSERERLFGQSDHVRIYGMDYVDRLKEAGFETDRFNPWGDEDFRSTGSKYGLNEQESIFLVRKPHMESSVSGRGRRGR